MTLTDYVIDLALIGVVVLQLRGRRLTLRNLLLPVVLVAWAARSYLHSIPTVGNDLLLISVCAALGIGLGAAAGLFTTVTTGEDGVPYARAGVAAAILWVVGVGFRFAFQLYATHGGAHTIGTFSAHHQITAQAWVAALVLMAIGEALARTGIVAARAYGPARLGSARTAMIGSR
jgi:hypothetical protein